ncbi:hypothetical protein [Streptacidiphilus fuscans]|uniref:Uncharacterized protein n=1 Tax=Streptacidiphilus fuscans TaxID=2789292 RepID=A0A931FEH8_9ACTN|nr:hypothetical protein [Streptacidiphilus fuscans]MBF9071777.1 hypothetical protein [Streptacidiphilus fuscans]
MAVKLIWPVEHSCGHVQEVDLSDRPADRRAGHARWLAQRPCRDCWQTEHRRDAEQTAAWLVARRAEERAQAAEWAEQFQMPPLDGPERALAWGETIRHKLVTAAYTVLVEEQGIDEEAWAAVEDQVRTVTRAGWWIDQREAEPADLSELLDAATDADRGTENPF